MDKLRISRTWVWSSTISNRDIGEMLDLQSIDFEPELKCGDIQAKDNKQGKETRNDKRK